MDLFLAAPGKGLNSNYLNHYSQFFLFLVLEVIGSI